MKLSVVINTYNRMTTLPTTLRALECLRYPKLEVVIVNGPSTDGTAEYLKANWTGKARICSCPEANLSKSRNVGIANSSGDIVCFTDDDGIPEPDWLDELAKAYDDPKVGAAGGWVRDPSGVKFQSRYIVSSRDSTSVSSLEDDSEVPPSTPATPKFPGLMGVNTSFRRSALLAIGGFDEEYAYFLDETDVLVRLIDAGHLVRTIPGAEVHHKFAPSHIRSTAGSLRSWKQMMTSISYFIVKNRLPDMTLADSFDCIERQKRDLRSSTGKMFKDGLIDEPRHDELLREIEESAKRGIADAYAYPSRQLLKPFETIDWSPLPRTLPFERRLRLAFVTGLYPPRPCGGVAVFIHNVARRLAGYGHEITVITQAEPDRPHTVDFENGVWVHRLPFNGIATELPEGMPDMPGAYRTMAGNVLAEINRANQRRRFQFVIGTIWDLDLAAVIASGKYPLAMYLVTSYCLMQDKPEWKQNLEYFEAHVKKMIRAERWALENAPHILASTNAIRRDVENAYGIALEKSRVSQLPFGLPGPDNLIVPRAEDGRVRLLYVGRFEYRKGADLILQVLPDLLERNANLDVICIGDNTLPTADGRPYIERFALEHDSKPWFKRISFMGHVDDHTLQQAYADCDIFMAPSRYESFGLIFLEAMRYGKPCIGANAGGMPEIVVDNETGFLAQPGDAPSLSRAIQKLISDAELRRKFGTAGFERYKQLFTIDRFANNLANLVSDWITA